MKQIFIGLLLSFSVSAIAAQLNLGGGESATINPSVSTTVTCGSGGDGNGSCNDSKNGLVKLMKACQSNYSAATCIDKYWPKFKQNNASCAMANIEICLTACETNYSAAYCADHCSE